MSNELPPETARRLLDFCAEYQKTYTVPLDTFDALRPEDFADSEACCPDTLQGTCIILDDAVTSVTGVIAAHVLVDFLHDNKSADDGTYDHYERAGWVKRAPEIKLEACDRPGWGFHSDSDSYYHDSGKASLWWQDDERTGWNYKFTRKDGTSGDGFVWESEAEAGADTVAAAMERAESGMAMASADADDSLDDLFAEPEEWAPWVKLAKAGERPDGLLDEERVDLQDHDGHTIAIRACGSWATATHYRRKRIRCVTERTSEGWLDLVWGCDACVGLTSTPGHYCLRGTLWTPATVPEVTAAKAGRDPNGVVAWHGGECPVGEGVTTRTYDRDGTVTVIVDPQCWRWTHSGIRPHRDIIAYEVTA